MIRLVGILFLSTYSIWTISCPLQDITFITEEYPPHSYIEKNVLKGIVVDILIAASTSVNCKVERSEIRVLPWARGYKRVLSEKNVVLFGMSKTLERENLFTWVGPIMEVNNSLIARKDSKLNVTNVADLHNLRIGVVRDDIGERVIVNLGIPKSGVYIASYPQNLAKMLAQRRIHVWSYDDIVGYWVLDNLGYNSKDFEVVYVVSKTKTHFAFNKQSNPEAVKLLQKGVDIIKGKSKDGIYSPLDIIIKKYL
ncbi:transporter substrate-binding domain-containing protein [Zooshikella marina]|uniref:substrate-binding periplasmic protein n=1 Tax=Zooshikella ganghwensis TaxID=202772 RepID=UPI001BAF208C|nr:transporter substrate-binding domain-containing protein [Zooshikella ganghwensis]MBU2707475.1 transporter substrate-binding domain-containing protein [Zooshikella ganghwensis]